MIAAVSNSTVGLSAAFQRFDGAAARVASRQSHGDPAAAVADTVQARFEVAINAAVLKASLEAEKHILDILV